MNEIKNDDKILADAVGIIRKHLGKDCQVFLFGSRADGTARDRSDYDIGIIDSQKIPLGKMVEIREEMENLPTLYSVDVIDFKNVSESFYNVAMQHIINL